MNGIGNVQGPARFEPVDVQRLREQAAPDTSKRGGPTDGIFTDVDRVELSEMAAFMATIRDLPDIRVEKVAEARAQIDAGTYETPEKIDATILRILDEIT